MAMQEFKMWSTQTNGGYFTAQEDHDAVLRRTVREHREAKEREARLDTEAKNIAEAILRLGHALYHDPARVFFEGQAHTPHFLGDGLFRDSEEILITRTWSKSNGLRQNSANWARSEFA